MRKRVYNIPTEIWNGSKASRGEGVGSMLVSCRYCGGMHRRGEVCPKKPKRDYTQHGERTEAQRTRSSSAWTRKAVRIKERDKYLCLVCLAQGKYTYRDLEAHHIVPIAEEPSLAFEDDNIVTLCQDHHREADEDGIDRGWLRSLVRRSTAGWYPPGGSDRAREERTETEHGPCTHTKA